MRGMMEVVDEIVGDQMAKVAIFMIATVLYAYMCSSLSRDGDTIIHV